MLFHRFLEEIPAPSSFLETELLKEVASLSCRSSLRTATFRLARRFLRSWNFFFFFSRRCVPLYFRKAGSIDPESVRFGAALF